MSSIPGKLADAAYATVVAGMVGGFAWTGWRWMHANTAAVDTWIPNWMSALSAVVCLTLSARLLEKLLPLRAISEERWVYRERPRHRIRGLDQESVVQVGVFAIFGAVLGLAAGHSPAGAALAVALRIGPGMVGSRRLPALLKAGRTRMIGASAWFVQDSELVADSIAAQWGHWRAGPPTHHLPLLFLRRLRRRMYLPVTGAAIVTATISLAGSLDRVGVILFLIAWAILGAGLYRCAEFSRVGVSSALPVVVLAIHGALATMVVWFVWGFALPILVIPSVIVAVMWTGIWRGRPRRNTDLTMVDTGLGVNIPPALTNYYYKGLGLSSVLAVIVAFFGI